MHYGKIISKSYLSGLIFSFLAVIAFGIVLSAVLLHFDIYRPLDANYSAVLSIIADLKETLVAKTIRISIIFTVVISVGLLALGIFYTHRIAGPLYRIKMSARAIGEGRLGTKIKFRRKDAIHPFAKSLSDMTACYSSRISRIRSDVQQLADAVTELQSAFEKDSVDDADLKKILEMDAEITRLLDRINT